MRVQHIKPACVDTIPEQIEDGVLYISERYNTAVHNCCCGCGSEVVTPLSPVNWSINVDEGKVTLHPSVGNWSYPCRSHYLIQRGRVVWAGSASQEEIQRIQARDKADMNAYVAERNLGKDRQEAGKPFWARLWKAITGWWEKH